MLNHLSIPQIVVTEAHYKLTMASEMLNFSAICSVIGYC